MTQEERTLVNSATKQAAFGLLRVTFFLAVPAVVTALLGKKYLIAGLSEKESDLAWMGIGFICSWVLIIADYKRITKKRKSQIK